MEPILSATVQVKKIKGTARQCYGDGDVVARWNMLLHLVLPAGTERLRIDTIPNLRHTLTLHSAAIILLFITLCTLSVIVCKLILTTKHRSRDRDRHNHSGTVTFPSVI